MHTSDATVHYSLNHDRWRFLLPRASLLCQHLCTCGNPRARDMIIITTSMGVSEKLFFTSAKRQARQEQGKKSEAQKSFILVKPRVGQAHSARSDSCNDSLRKRGHVEALEGSGLKRRSGVAGVKGPPTMKCHHKNPHLVYGFA